MHPPSETSLETFAPGGEQAEYTPEERTLLLHMAREAIASSLDRREISTFAPSQHLSEVRGVFTSLYARAKLRGCVGYPLAIVPLYRAVIETAKSAAFDDPRFLPVTRSEFPELKISLSILSPMQPIHAEEVQVGRHGLLISSGGCRGLLLPQVPVAHGWDRVTFLEQTCLKACLPRHAWRSGAQIEAFTAEVFAEAGALPQ